MFVMELLNVLINKFPSAKDCCCCCSLETGCKIIGWVQTVVSGLFLILYIVLLASFAVLIVALPGVSIFGIFVTILSGALNAGIFVLGVYLLLGVYRGDSNKVHIWLKGNTIILAIHVLILIFDLIGAILTVGYMIGPFFATLIWIGATVYCIMVVKGFYDENTRTPDP